MRVRGVVDASVEAKDQDCGRKVAWALNCYQGRLRTCTNPAKQSATYKKKLMKGNLKGKANGSTVRLRIDMAARSLAVSVNGQPFIDTDEQLPAAGVKLWVHLRTADDTVELTSTTMSVAA